MCPNIRNRKKMARVCPGIPGTPHPQQTECDFVIVWRKEDGTAVFVSRGLGTRKFMAGHRSDWGGFHREYAKFLPMHKTFDEVQKDLNLFAEKKGWTILPSLTLV